MRHLRFFVAVAEEGHFGRAAQRLEMTQPPVSQGLRRLERELGVELLRRTARGAELTDAGAALLPQARLLVDDGLRFTGAARRLRHELDAVRWGIAAHVDPTLVAVIAGALRGQGRQETTVAGSLALVESVRAGSLDLAIVEHPCVTGDLLVGPIVKIPRRVVVAADHPLATARRPALRMLTGLALCHPARSDNPPALDLLIDTLRARGLDPEVVPFSGVAPQAAAVARGDAFSLITASPGVEVGGIPGTAVIVVAPDELVLRLRVISRAQSATPAVDAVMSALWKLR